VDIEELLLDLTNDDLLAWKTALAALVVALAGLQVGLAARFWSGGGLPLDPALASRLHRWNGRVLLLLSVVVAYACLFGPAGPTSPARVLLHSIFGTVLFALLALKFAALHLDRPHGAADKLPVIGIALFVDYVLIWALSALDYVTADIDPAPGGGLRAWVFVLAGVAAVTGAWGITGLVRRRSGSLAAD
jgi:hypothetical protein